MGTEAAAHASHEVSTLQDYVQVLRRRRWLVLQAVVLVPLAAVLLSLRQDALYSASAEVLLRQNPAASLNGTVDPGANQEPERLIQTQAELARAPEVARKVLERTGLRDRNIHQFFRASSAEPKQNANLLMLSVRDERPALAVRLANTYAREFTRYRTGLESIALVRARREIEERIAELERRGERSSALYASLVEKEQQLKTAEALESSSTVLVNTASRATKVRPQPLRNAALGLALGIVLGIALAFLWEALDTRVRSTREIERRLGLPLLARIPAPPRWAQRTGRLVMVSDPNGIEAEAFRVMRTNLDFFNMEHRARTIMVTSAVAGEGKSTTVANLAVALARAGQRVILVDLDLRKPTLDRFFRFEGRPGLTDVALGRAQLAPVVLDENPGPGQAQGKLDVLTTGPLPKDTGEFIGGAPLEAILDELRERADVVLIDSPPLLAVGDAISLSAKVDAMIVLTRLAVVRRAVIDELRRVLGTCRAAKIGFVVTGAELEQEHRYGYGYGGYAHTVQARATTREDA